MIKIKSIFFLFIIVLLSCEKETELSIPEPETNLVVNTILQANKVIKVYVAHSIYSLDTTSMYITKAIVVATDSITNNSDTLNYSSNGIYISSNMNCEAGKTYKISVYTSSYGNATSSTKVPSTTKFSGHSFMKNAGTSPDGFKTNLLSVNIPDSPGEENFYMLFIHCLLDTLIGPTVDYTSAWYSYSPIIIAEGDEYEKTFSDKLFAGDTAVIPMYFHMWDLDYWYSIIYGATNLPFTLNCYLFTINKSYYDYFKSYLSYNEAIDDIWQMNSPPIIYTNIDNALGICAAVNLSDSIHIDF